MERRKMLMQILLYFFQLDIEVSVIVGNWRYRLKKSRSTVIRHLYGKINQNLPKSNLQNQIKRESEQKEKTHNIKGKWTYIRPLIKLTSSSNWNSYMPRSISLSCISSILDFGISVIMENKDNDLRSHGVPLSAIYTGK